MPTRMHLQPEDITIAVTVYGRREFVLGAIRSALDQTVSARVIVVEDCGPDPGLREIIVGRFGDRISYFRNPKNRGLFDNWNACMEYCTTPWLSILHDDDLLHPWFVETMLRLHEQAPGHPIYFGDATVLEGERVRSSPPVRRMGTWRQLDLAEFAESNLVWFPGQLFSIAEARAVGNVRSSSFFTGDWDFWFRMALRGGLVQTATEVSVVRSHSGADRGTSRVERMGWKWALENVQRKRNLALLGKERGIGIPFNRRKHLKARPIPTRSLLRNARGFSRRMLAYNHWLFVHSHPPHLGYRAFQLIARMTGPPALRLCSILWNRWRSPWNAL